LKFDIYKVIDFKRSDEMDEIIRSNTCPMIKIDKMGKNDMLLLKDEYLRVKKILMTEIIEEIELSIRKDTFEREIKCTDH